MHMPCYFHEDAHAPAQLVVEDAHQGSTRASLFCCHLDNNCFVLLARHEVQLFQPARYQRVSVPGSAPHSEREAQLVPRRGARNLSRFRIDEDLNKFFTPDAIQHKLRKV